MFWSICRMLVRQSDSRTLLIIQNIWLWEDKYLSYTGPLINPIRLLTKQFLSKHMYEVCFPSKIYIYSLSIYHLRPPHCVFPPLFEYTVYSVFSPNWPRGTQFFLLPTCQLEVSSKGFSFFLSTYIYSLLYLLFVTFALYILYVPFCAPWAQSIKFISLPPGGTPIHEYTTLYL